MSFNFGSFLGTVKDALPVVGQIGQAFGIKELSRFTDPAARPMRTPYSPPPMMNTSFVSNGSAQQRGLMPAGITASDAVRALAAGERFVSVAGDALARFRGAQQAGPAPLDILGAGFEDPSENEVAKIAAVYGGIPAETDLGAILIGAGARTKTVRVKLSDGSRVPMKVVAVAGTRSGRPRRTNYNTPARRRDAARTLRAATRDIRIAKRLAASARKLDRLVNPKRTSSKPPARRRR